MNEDESWITNALLCIFRYSSHNRTKPLFTILAFSITSQSFSITSQNASQFVWFPWRIKKSNEGFNASLRTHHVYSTLKRRFNVEDRWYVCRVVTITNPIIIIFLVKGWVEVSFWNHNSKFSRNCFPEEQMHSEI